MADDESTVAVKSLSQLVLVELFAIIVFIVLPIFKGCSVFGLALANLITTMAVKKPVHKGDSSLSRKLFLVERFAIVVLIVLPQYTGWSVFCLAFTNLITILDIFRLQDNYPIEYDSKLFWTERVAAVGVALHYYDPCFWTERVAAVGLFAITSVFCAMDYFINNSVQIMINIEPILRETNKGEELVKGRSDKNRGSRMILENMETVERALFWFERFAILVFIFIPRLQLPWSINLFCVSNLLHIHFIQYLRDVDRRLTKLNMFRIERAAMALSGLYTTDRSLYCWFIVVLLFITSNAAYIINWIEAKQQQITIVGPGPNEINKDEESSKGKTEAEDEPPQANQEVADKETSSKLEEILVEATEEDTNEKSSSKGSEIEDDLSSAIRKNETNEELDMEEVAVVEGNNEELDMEEFSVVDEGNDEELDMEEFAVVDEGNIDELPCIELPRFRNENDEYSWVLELDQQVADKESNKWEEEFVKATEEEDTNEKSSSKGGAIEDDLSSDGSEIEDDESWGSSESNEPIKRMLKVLDYCLNKSEENFKNTLAAKDKAYEEDKQMWKEERNYLIANLNADNEDNRRKWEEEKKAITAELGAAIKSLNEYDGERRKWEAERTELTAKLLATTSCYEYNFQAAYQFEESAKYYKTCLHKSEELRRKSVQEEMDLNAKLDAAIMSLNEYDEERHKWEAERTELMTAKLSAESYWHYYYFQALQYANLYTTCLQRTSTQISARENGS